jgi:hypothetical protein
MIMHSRLLNSFKSILNNSFSLFSSTNRHKSIGSVVEHSLGAFNLQQKHAQNLQKFIPKPSLVSDSFNSKEYYNELENAFRLLSNHKVGPSTRMFTSILAKLLELKNKGIKVDNKLLSKAYYGKAFARMSSVPTPDENEEVITEFKKAIELDPSNEQAKLDLEDFLMATGITPIIRAKPPNFS